MSFQNLSYHVKSLIPYNWKHWFVFPPRLIATFNDPDELMFHYCMQIACNFHDEILNDPDGIKESFVEESVVEELKIIVDYYRNKKNDIEYKTTEHEDIFDRLMAIRHSLWV